ncbi:uncharacterized protein LOC119665956 [Teleopsis dalmanni]|uniref:uncharacterized protein LOC119665956 n=1 Tax=Teleopsis dalmanni TaxID=139649 RepID=UPI0018CE1472|nr:uncharacterized protein LOC119665956 [Teleopsis dalmanni]
MHIAGKNSPVADFLSRIEAISNEDLVDFDQLAESQKTDIETNGFLSNSNKSALQLKWILIPNSSKEIACDVSSNRVRPFVTEQWPAVVPIEDIHASTVAIAFTNGWIIHFGVPKQIITDQGRQFESTLFNELEKLIGAKHIRTSPRHPQANGLIERFHRTLKTAMKCKHEHQWSDAIPLIVLALRNIFKDLKVTTSEMVYGTTLRLPSDFLEQGNNDKIPEHEFVENMRQMMSQIRSFPTSNHLNERVFLQKELQHATHVFLRDDSVRPPLKTPYDGPFKVVRRSDKTYDLLIKGKPVRVSVDRVKAAFLSSDNEDVSPSCTENMADTRMDTKPSNVTRKGRLVQVPRRYVKFDLT